MNYILKIIFPSLLLFHVLFFIPSTLASESPCRVSLIKKITSSISYANKIYSDSKRNRALNVWLKKIIPDFHEKNANIAKYFSDLAEKNPNVGSAEFEEIELMLSKALEDISNLFFLKTNTLSLKDQTLIKRQLENSIHEYLKDTKSFFTFFPPLKKHPHLLKQFSFIFNKLLNGPQMNLLRTNLINSLNQMNISPEILANQKMLYLKILFGGPFLISLFLPHFMEAFSLLPEGMPPSSFPLTLFIVSSAVGSLGLILSSYYALYRTIKYTFNPNHHFLFGLIILILIFTLGFKIRRFLVNVHLSPLQRKILNHYLVEIEQNLMKIDANEISQYQPSNEYLEQDFQFLKDDLSYILSEKNHIQSRINQNSNSFIFSDSHLRSETKQLKEKLDEWMQEKDFLFKKDLEN